MTTTGPWNRELAHRAEWEKINGPIPAGMQVLHKCDNRWCVNTNHLFLGTQSDNLRDMIAKDRHNPYKVMNEMTIAEAIRLRSMGYPYRYIAFLLNVGPTTIQRYLKCEQYSSLSQK